MADNRPIGVFDSGVGGLTVLHALQSRVPHESTIYLGDLARCPYGTRPQTDVRGYAIQIADLLADAGIKLLVVACNTATAAAVNVLAARYPFPVVGVIEPGARQAAQLASRGRVGVIATDGTVASGAYRDALLRIDPRLHVVQRSASWLVPVIEWGPIARPRVAAGLRPLLQDLQREDIDLLILGCTHFPLVEDIFAAEAGPEIKVLDSATTTADAVAEVLHRAALEGNASPSHRILVTGGAEAFTDRARAMFHESLSIETIDLAMIVS